LTANTNKATNSPKPVRIDVVIESYPLYGKSTLLLLMAAAIAISSTRIRDGLHVFSAPWSVRMFLEFIRTLRNTVVTRESLHV